MAQTSVIRFFQGTVFKTLEQEVNTYLAQNLSWEAVSVSYESNMGGIVLILVLRHIGSKGDSYSLPKPS